MSDQNPEELTEVDDFIINRDIKTLKHHLYVRVIERLCEKYHITECSVFNEVAKEEGEKMKDWLDEKYFPTMQDAISELKSEAGYFIVPK